MHRVEAPQQRQLVREAVREDDGRIVDFVFREINLAACTYLQASRDELLGATLTALLRVVEKKVAPWTAGGQED